MSTLVVGAVLGAGVVVLVGLIRLRGMKSWGRHNTHSEIDVRWKTIIITGASSGIGKEVAYEMLKRGAVVVIPCRSVERGQSIVTELMQRPGASNGTLVPMEMDLMSLDSVRYFVAEFSKRFDHVDILINNAGVFTSLKKEKVTKDGFEYNLGVNYLSHFLLTNLLLDHCKAATVNGDLCRIVNVSSTFHEKGELRLDDLNLRNVPLDDIKSVKPYHNSKLAQVYFSYELAKRLSGSRVHTYSLCPGWVYTSLGRDMDLSWYNYLLLVPLGSMFMRTPNQGIQTILHCALSTKCGTETGKLYRNCEIWRSKVMPLSDKISTALWEKSAELTGLQQ